MANKKTASLLLQIQRDLLPGPKQDKELQASCDEENKFDLNNVSQRCKNNRSQRDGSRPDHVKDGEHPTMEGFLHILLQEDIDGSSVKRYRHAAEEEYHGEEDKYVYIGYAQGGKSQGEEC